MAIMVCLHSLSKDEEKRLLRGQLRVQRYLRPRVILEDQRCIQCGVRENLKRLRVKANL